ncbi:MAG: cytochrome c biogenesis protein CcsA [Flavobacteriia bacterium]|nr:cytochrome c biogenesis protein CcsA [Flavobacteriia bacterium]
MKKHWWKALSVLMITYTLWAGLMGEVPLREILDESIRNLYFHVTMWFAMLLMFIISVVNAVRYLSGSKEKFDARSNIYAETGLVFSLMGLVTGMLWAKYTWGAYFTNDPKLNGAAISILIYAAYFILRGSIKNPDQRGRISAVYNIFAFVLMIVFIQILPRMNDSLHPGNGGNPAFSQYDLDNNMRPVFYTAVVGWMLFGVWMSRIRYRIHVLKMKNETVEDITNEILD